MSDSGLKVQKRPSLRRRALMAMRRLFGERAKPQRREPWGAVWTGRMRMGRNVGRNAKWRGGWR